MDGVDIRELNRTYVSLTRDQVITGSKQFLEKVILDESCNLRAPHIEVEGTVVLRLAAEPNDQCWQKEIELEKRLEGAFSADLEHLRSPAQDACVLRLQPMIIENVLIV